MSEKPLTNSINALTTYINEVTGETDENLSDAVQTLIGGYGGYSLDDIASGTVPSGDLVINSNEIVGYFAFANRNITSIYAPYVKSVGINSFNTCTSILDVKMPMCETLGTGAFQSCSKVKNIEVPSLIRASQSVFMSCVALTSIYLPLVESVENQAFRACTSLTELKLPSCSSITGANIFTSDTKLTDIYLPNDASTYTGAPWGAPNATIHYNTVFDENGEPILE